MYALLGPTNTGKTHRAIERMLDFESGMMGLPLRLLAREVYDRLSSELGEQAVALVTGEEKRVPARPRYWICTVEAMPVALDVEFAAVDEIQLISHPERGHVFTDRLLHLRGRAETWFMGAETVETILRTHLPLAQIRKLPRLSKLSYTGPSSLRSLPRRSAVVAFSLPQVYELADVLRVRRGGAAVVLGALSPRVRNAQVALYQSGEVDFLVATDAIGMGLNLDIDHVALASRSKFDGFETRELEVAELAQIAGRAGRYLRDGSFGVLSPEPELSPRLVEQLTEHRFGELRYAYYRNSDLDFESLNTLQESLIRKPRGFALRAAPDADDLLVLRALASLPEVRALTQRAERVQLLWELCRIPNYEKRLPEHQAQRLLPLLRELSTRGKLSRELVESEVGKLARYEGDLHALMDRLSAIRTWSYVSQKPHWLSEPDEWRERTRAIEDRLGDVLHERLLARFVSERSTRRPHGEKHNQRTERQLAGHPFGKLAALMTPGREQLDFHEQLIAARFDELSLSAEGVVMFEGQRVAKLVAGPSLLHPQPKLLLEDVTASGLRSRIERRMLAHTRDLVSDLLGPLQLPGELSAPLRGLLYQLQQGLGSTSRREASAELSALSELDRRLLAEAEIVLGRDALFSRPTFSSPRMRLRAVLCRLLDPTVAQLPRGFEHGAATRSLASIERATALCLGFVKLRSWLVRCDVLEMLVRSGAADPAFAPEERVEKLRTLLGGNDEQARELAQELLPRRRARRR